MVRRVKRVGSAWRQLWSRSPLVVVLVENRILLVPAVLALLGLPVLVQLGLGRLEAALGLLL